MGQELQGVCSWRRSQRTKGNPAWQRLGPEQCITPNVTWQFLNHLYKTQKQPTSALPQPLGDRGKQAE